MTAYLLIPKMKIINANAINSPYSIGFPAMTAWLGAAHALQRKIQSVGLKVFLNKMAVVCHQCDLQTCDSIVGRRKYIIGTANPLKKNKKTGEFEKPPFIEEGRCHLNVSLLIEISGINPDNENKFLTEVSIQLNKMKIAGGDVIKFKKPEIYYISEENKQKTRLIKNKLMPGYVIVERRDLVNKAMEDGLDGIDALLEYIKITYTLDNNDTENPIWRGSRKSPGWIIPMGVGFKGISKLGKVENQRDSSVMHRFAESVVTLCEFKMPYRFDDLDDMMWQYSVDTDKKLYICKNQY
ncbi:type I-F CRISPR-associated protein Csy2 [Pectinatus frisingensis]|uniref:type I-F CRISPR-associated protein Csy2 n=1 Tax=Pectinatus frisingensis TaxID=865 RepID=UPI0018C48A77